MSIFKIVIIGDTGAGKTCLLARIIGSQFRDEHLPTIGVEFANYQVDNGDRLQFWDTAGQQRFRAITTSYYKGCVVVIVVFDVSERQSLRKALMMADQARRINPTAAFMFIGNKADLEKKVQVEDLDELHEKWNTSYMEISTKYGIPQEQIICQIQNLCHGAGPTPPPPPTMPTPKKNSPAKFLNTFFQKLTEYLYQTIDP